MPNNSIKALEVIILKQKYTPDMLCTHREKSDSGHGCKVLLKRMLEKVESHSG